MLSSTAACGKITLSENICHAWLLLNEHIFNDQQLQFCRDTRHKLARLRGVGVGRLHLFPDKRSPESESDAKVL
jgi:hypothetical protein